MKNESQGIINLWNRFWFSEEPKDILCLLRIFFGIIFLMKLTGCTGFMTNMHVELSIPQHTFSSDYVYRLSGFVQSVPGFGWLPLPSYKTYLLIEDIVFVLALFFTSGLFATYTGPLLAMLYGYLFVLDQMGYHHHTFLFVIVLFILGFSNCSSRYSLDSYLHGGTFGKVKGIAMPRRMLQILVSAIYFFGALSKINPGWLSGDIIRVLGMSGALHGPLGHFIMKSQFYLPLSVSTPILEFFLAIALWFDKTVRIAVLCGVLFHLVIDMTINVSTFSFQMIALYTVFAYPGTKSTTIFIDPGKVKQAVLIRFLLLFDWLRRFGTVVMKGGTPAAIPEVYTKSGILVRKRGGDILTGIDAFSCVLGMLPLFFPFAWLIKIFSSVRRNISRDHNPA